MKTKKFFTFVMGLLLSLLVMVMSCSTRDDFQDSVAETHPDGTESVVVSTIVPFTVTPTFLSRPDCSTENPGRIIFTRRQSGMDTLFIMDGNGCNVQELLSGVSDSPAWALHTGEIAVGCEDATAICILNIDNEPPGRKHVQLPQKCIANWIKSISWLPNGSDLIVACGRPSEPDEVYKITLNSDNKYQTILSAEEVLRAVSSPLGDKLAVSIPPYIYSINVDGSSKTRLAEGTSPEWSPDGTKIVFLKEDEERGIAMINPDGTDFEWLYIPGKAIGLGCSEVRSDCRLAWSPDGRYIAFNGLYVPYIEPGINYQIFRLDLLSKKVEILSNDSESRLYSEPDWEP